MILVREMPASSAQMQTLQICELNGAEPHQIAMATGADSAAKSGRPRNFSEDAALEAAMRLFWERGYEGSSITDLTRAMGINKSSLYTIFGDKEALFRSALKRYKKGPASYMWQSVEEPTARRVVEAMLKKATTLLTKPGNPRGCLSVQGALAVGVDSESAKQALIDFRKTGEVALTERFVQAQQAGEIAPYLAPEDLARYVLTFMVGLGVQSANGATRKQLEKIASIMLRCLPF